MYDLKSSIDYVLAVSEQPSLYYVGHSMGTTALLALLSTRPQYNQRVRIAALLAPVAYFSHLRGALSLALPLFSSLEVRPARAPPAPRPRPATLEASVS